VVATRRLYPRSLFGGPSTDADRRALEAYAEEATYAEEEEVDARFTGDAAKQQPARPPARPAGSAGERR